MDRINVRLEPQMKQELESAALAEGTTPSDVVRQALRAHLDRRLPGRSALDAAREAGIVGVYDDLPGDLSTNPKHMECFGE
jgi:Arc/MetJ-type ribon-helix-helix transcriptional regulator